jgi:[Skp1-protein]-hydroxyproline N-acetylglucosaminyltransferase
MNEILTILVLLTILLILYCVFLANSNKVTIEKIQRIKSSKTLPSKFSNDDSKEILFKNYEKLVRDLNFNNVCDIKKVKSKPVDERTIFISVASYRDDECPNTLNSIYKNAKFPNRIFVGICQQNHTSDIDCLNENNNPNVSIIRLSDFEAKGPTYARYVCSKLYNKQDYYMQIDSHIHFVKNWDTKIIDMIDNIKSENDKIVITHHPKDWINEDKSTDETVSTFCTSSISSVNVISVKSALITNNGLCRLIPYCAAGFFFTYGCFLNEVPFDPNLPQLFEGEEGLFSIRLWTSGWDMYSPNSDICYHYYTRADKPKYWSNPDYAKYVDKSIYKVKLLMGLNSLSDEDISLYGNDFKLYGLGSTRTLADYYKFIGFNKDLKTFSTNFCS